MSWENNVRRVTPYIPGEQPKVNGIIKLNTNENPYPPSPKVQEVLKNFDYSKLTLYPDPNCTKLVEAIVDYHSLRPGQVFVGVGSDDVISTAFMAFFNNTDDEHPILFPDVTYSFYKVWADVHNVKYKEIPLNEDFLMYDNCDEYFKSNRGIIFPNPNAPTGRPVVLKCIEEIVSNNPNSVVIIDEAYIDFVTNYSPDNFGTCLDMINNYDNLLVVRTFSKSRSMAGMRIGYAVGSEKLIKYLNDVKFSINSYTMSNLALECGVASIEDDNYFNEQIKRICKTRSNTVARLQDLGFSIPRSWANFVFAKCPKTENCLEGSEGIYIFNALKKRKIYVRHWNEPKIKDYLRITIGTDEQMNALISALEEILK